jgi:hypothetical protein
MAACRNFLRQFERFDTLMWGQISSQLSPIGRVKPPGRYLSELCQDLTYQSRSGSSRQHQNGLAASVSPLGLAMSSVRYHSEFCQNRSNPGSG